jgi:hypothetical protein
MNDWKPTVAGILTGATVLLQQGYDSLVAGNPVNWGLVAVGIGIMAVGKLAAGINPPKP